MSRPWSTLVVFTLTALQQVNAFFFFFEWPAQTTSCEVVNLVWRDAEPPFQAVVVPMYSQPFIYDIPSSAYNGSYGTYPIQLQIPGDSNYVVYMSDGHGRYTGGSSAIQALQTSNDTSCLATKSANQSALDFTFTISGQAKQCEAGFETSWSGGTEDGPYNMTVVPLDSSFYPFEVPFDTDLRHQSSWVVNITEGSRFTIFMNNGKGYGRGGTGGVYVASAGSGSSCIVADVSPTGVWPSQIGINTLGAATLPITSSSLRPSASSARNHNSGGSNTAGIAGGVVGGVVALALLVGLVLFCRRKRRKQRAATLPTDHSHAFDDDDDEPGSHAMIEPYRPLSHPAPGHGLLADPEPSPTDSTSQRDSMGTHTSAGFAGFGAPSPRTAGYSDEEVGSSNRQAGLRPLKGAPAPVPVIAPPRPAAAHPKAAEADNSFGSNSSHGSAANLINLSPASAPPRGALQITNHDAAAEEQLTALPPGAEGRRRNRQSPSGPGGFRRHEDAGRLDGGENAPVASGEIIDLPPLYQEVPR